MHVSRIIVGMIACAFSCQLAWSQDVSPASTRGTLGYFDYSTGAFRPVRHMEDFDSDSLAAASAQTGTITVNFTVTVKSAIPASSPITCGISAIVTEGSLAGVNIILEDATVAATRSGNTAKCTVTIPYSWTVLNPTTARLDLNYTLSASKAGTGIVSRSSSGSIASIPVPASGATTTQTVNAVL